MNQPDNISLKRIETAHPEIREDLRKAFCEASDRINGKVFLRLAYVLRTFDEQSKLYDLGRTVLFNEKGERQGKVTFAKAGQSFHNYGLAFDIVLIYRDKPKAEFNTTADFDNDHKADWMEAVEVFKKYGFEWGGEWSAGKCDLPHFQKTFGFSWSELLTKYNSKQFINNSYYPILDK